VSLIRNLVLGIALATAPLAGTAAAAGDDADTLLVEWAATPAQHQALAAHYKVKAEEAKEEAARHRAMAKSYSSSKQANVKPMADHCNKLATLADGEAAEYEKMAAAHAAMK
jgi:hypothetical protein